MTSAMVAVLRVRWSRLGREDTNVSRVMVSVLVLFCVIMFSSRVRAVSNRSGSSSRGFVDARIVCGGRLNGKKYRS